MFEIGFSEILVIVGIALLVLGPQKLPKLARQVGHWTGRARAMARQLRTQLEQEVDLEEALRASPRKTEPPPSSNAAARYAAKADAANAESGAVHSQVLTPEPYVAEDVGTKHSPSHGEEIPPAHPGHSSHLHDRTGVDGVTHSSPPDANTSSASSAADTPLADASPLHPHS